MEKVPYMQKQLIAKCRVRAIPSIVATQMLYTMVESPRPSRAEISDVANAVYDGADCLMLSEESAIGAYPVEVIKTMARIADFNEEKGGLAQIELQANDAEEAIAAAAIDLCRARFDPVLKPQKIVVLTETGRTARLVSRYRSPLDIIAVTKRNHTAQLMTLVYGVFSCNGDLPENVGLSKQALIMLAGKKLIKKGESIIVISGEQWGIPGKTNTVSIQTAP